MTRTIAQCVCPRSCGPINASSSVLISRIFRIINPSSRQPKTFHTSHQPLHPTKWLRCVACNKWWRHSFCIDHSATLSVQSFCSKQYFRCLLQRHVISFDYAHKTYYGIWAFYVHACRLQVGDKLPEITLFEGAPDGAVKLTDLFAGKKGVLFAVPGAFTPGCSKVNIHTNLSPLHLNHQCTSWRHVSACITTERQFSK